MVFARSIILMAILAVFAASPAVAEKRVALVIGNAAYKDLNKLSNPVTDAEKITVELQANGYKVLAVYDATREKFLDALETFRKSYLPGAKEAFVFYAGHGMTVEGRDVLAPIDLSYDCDDATGLPNVRREVSWDEVERNLRSVPNLIIVLDACRSNVFQRCTKRGPGDGEGFRGLSRTARAGTLIVNSTALGSSAQDGAAGHGSPFANALLKQMRSAPQSYYSELFSDVSADVSGATSGTQIPEVLVRGGAPKICLAGVCGSGGTVTPAPTDEAAIEWGAVDKNSGAELQTFIKRHGSSPFAVYANARLDALKKKRTDTAMVTPSQIDAGSGDDDACGDGAVLVSVAIGPKPCIKPGSGKTFKDCPECPEMTIVPAGSFTMGSPKNEDGRSDDESPQRKVTISQPFGVGRTHITRGEFAAFVKATGYDATGGCYTVVDGQWKLNEKATWKSPGFEQADDHPAVCINWNDAKAYIAWVNKKVPGKPYRLLTEAEAEYAARGVTKPGSYQRFFFGNGASDLCDYANGLDQTAKSSGKTPSTWTYNSCQDGYTFTAPVASFKANAWGVYDVAGNANTWTEDCYHESYNDASSDGSAITTGECSRRVLRGGSWGNIPQDLRAASRGRNDPDIRYDNDVFRLARTLPLKS